MTPMEAEGVTIRVVAKLRGIADLIHNENPEPHGKIFTSRGIEGIQVLLDDLADELDATTKGEETNETDLRKIE